jgi:anthranilate phosphoribosyltransferase
MPEASPMIGTYINRLISGENLTKEETVTAGELIVNDEITEIQQGAFLAALTAKGPTPEEICGIWQTLYEYDTVQCAPRIDGPIMDNCGTGMDGFKTFNISTAAAIVAARAGVCMARHGARAVTSHCGTVDVCEKLGIDVDCEVGLVQRGLEQARIGIFNGMSPHVHPRALFRLLRAMGFGSILNISASLANPVHPRLAVRGVYSKDMVKTVVETMKAMGFCRALVFHGEVPGTSGGMDEISPFGTTWLAELKEDGTIMYGTIHAKEFSAMRVHPASIAGGSGPQQEALNLAGLLSGKEQGSRFFTVCLNTAPILYLADKVDTLQQGMDMAAEILQSGEAIHTLKDWIRCQNRDPESGLDRFHSLLEQLDVSSAVGG